MHYNYNNRPCLKIPCFILDKLMTMLQRVLHVEDDPSIRMVTSVALEKVGNLEVLSCEGGEQAMAKAVAVDPQVLLLDVMMPAKDGPATLKGLGKVLDRTLLRCS